MTGKWLKQLDAAKFYVLCAALLGTMYVFLTPPMQVSDETTHFFRSYQVSMGDVRPVKIAEGLYGGLLPANVISYSLDLLHGTPFKPTVKLPKDLTRQYEKARISNEKARVEFTNIAIYSPVAYMPQATGIVLARMLPGRPLFLLSFYLARLCNLFVAITLMYFAIKWMPFGKWAVTTVFLTPMALYEFGSVSGDALTYSLTVFTIALSLASYLQLRNSTTLTTQRLAVLGVLAVLLALLRVPYNTVAILPIFVLYSQYIRAKKPTAAVLATVGVSLLCLLLAFWWQNWFQTMTLQISRDPSVHPADQLRNVTDLSWMARVLGQTHLTGMHNMAVGGFIGVLGWMDVFMPQWLVISYFIVLAFAFFVREPDEKHLPTRQMRWLALGGFGVTVLLIDIAEYIFFTPLRAPYIWGMQGRYYLPLVIILLVATVGWLRLARVDWIKLHHIRLGLIIVANGTAIIMMLNRFYGNVL